MAEPKILRAVVGPDARRCEVFIVESQRRVRRCCQTTIISWIPTLTQKSEQKILAFGRECSNTSVPALEFYTQLKPDEENAVGHICALLLVNRVRAFRRQRDHERESSVCS